MTNQFCIMPSQFYIKTLILRDFSRIITKESRFWRLHSDRFESCYLQEDEKGTA